MYKAVLSTALFSIFLTSTAFAQDDPSGVWEFHDSSEFSGPVRMTIRCFSDGNGSSTWSDGAVYPARCSRNGNVITVKGWGARSAMNRGEAPAIIYRITFDGERVIANPRNGSTGEALAQSIGKKSGTKGRTAAQIASSSQSQGSASQGDASSSGNRASTNVSRASTATMSSDGIQATMPEWNKNPYSACRQTAEALRLQRRQDNRDLAIQAFRVGCTMTHRLKYSRAGNPSLLKCNLRGEFSSDVQKKLQEESLGSYQAYAEEAWSAWESNLGCR